MLGTGSPWLVPYVTNRYPSNRLSPSRVENQRKPCESWAMCWTNVLGSSSAVVYALIANVRHARLEKADQATEYWALQGAAKVLPAPISFPPIQR